MRTKRKENFKWELRNVESMINSINESLQKLGIDEQKFKLSLSTKGLSLGNGVIIKEDMAHLGQITHTLICLLMVLKSQQKDRNYQLVQSIGTIVQLVRET